VRERERGEVGKGGTTMVVVGPEGGGVVGVK